MGSTTSFKAQGFKMFKCRSLLALSVKVMRRTAILAPWCQRCFVSPVLTPCGRKDPVKAAMIAAKPPALTWPMSPFLAAESFWTIKAASACVRGACKACRSTMTKSPWKCSHVWQRCVYSICLHTTLQLRWWFAHHDFLLFDVLWWWAMWRTVKQIIQ